MHVEMVCRNLAATFCGCVSRYVPFCTPDDNKKADTPEVICSRRFAILQVCATRSLDAESNVVSPGKRGEFTGAAGHLFYECSGVIVEPT